MMPISISNETTTNILLLLVAFSIFWFVFRATNAHFRAKEGKRRQEELDAADKRARKAVKTLLPVASDTTGNSVSTKDVTELYRTALGPQSSSQNGHSLSKLILEALKKALSAYLKQ